MRAVVIHYEPAEAALLAQRLRRDGLNAEPYPCVGSKGFRELRENPPDAIVIDLMRLPSYGRTMGALLRETKGTRAIPLVFLEGDPEKTSLVRRALPDAVFARMGGLAAAVRRAVRIAPSDPVVPDSSAVPPARKLRIGEGAAVSLIGAPEGFERLLPGAQIRRSRDADIVLLFVKSAPALGRDLPRLAERLPRALWVLWPKRKSGASGDLALPAIHEACAPLGLVAYKTCSVDDTWSAAAVARRRGRARPNEAV